MQLFQRKECISSSITPSLTLELALGVGAVDAPQLGDGPRCPQVEHDHVHASFHRLPRLCPLTHCRALLQQRQERQDMREGCVGQGAAFCGTEIKVGVYRKMIRHVSVFISV